MRNDLMIQEHEIGLHDDPRIRQTRLGRCPGCSLGPVANGAVRGDLEAQLRAAQEEIAELRGDGTATRPRPTGWDGKSLGDGIKAVLGRIRRIEVEVSDDLDDVSDFDAGSLCPVCKGNRWLRDPKSEGAKPGAPEFGRVVLCEACPEARAMAERKATMPSGVPKKFANCTLDNFPVTYGENGSHYGFETVRDWMISLTDQTSKNPFFYLYGANGTGKTSLSAACVHLWENMTGTRALWMTADQLFDRIRATYDEDSTQSTESVVDELKTIRFLVIDDIGTSKVTQWLVEKLFDLINARHNEGRATMFTSNLDIDQLAMRLNDGTPANLPKPGRRITWRIISAAGAGHELMGPNLHDPGTRARLGLEQDTAEVGS